MRAHTDIALTEVLVIHKYKIKAKYLFSVILGKQQ